MNNVKELIEGNNDSEEIIQQLTEGLDDRSYESILRDLKDVLGVLSGPVGGGAIDQIFSAGDGLNDAVSRLMKDLADQRSFNKSQVDQAFDKSGLSSDEFVSQVKQFAKKAV